MILWRGPDPSLLVFCFPMYQDMSCTMLADELGRPLYGSYAPLITSDNRSFMASEEKSDVGLHIYVGDPSVVCSKCFS